MRVKAVQLMLNAGLPPDMRDYDRPVTAKGIGKLLHEVALRIPDQYSGIVKNLGDTGRNAAYWQGESMGLNDLRDVIDTKAYLDQMDQEVEIKTKGIRDPEELRRVREGIWFDWSSKIERDAMKAALQKNNAVGLSVASGARGKPTQLRAMLATPGTFEDSRGRGIPLYARRSYAKGVSPGEWLAGTYGARTSVTATKVSTAKGGFTSKLLAQTAGNLMVTEDDCGTNNGLDLPPDDPAVRRRFLAQPVAGIEAGELLDRKAMARLQNSKTDTVLVRSPVTCQAKKGVCARCIGADASGKPYPVGYAAGVTASNAVGEPLTQMALNTKHLSGAASKKKSYSGLDWIQRFIQIPDNFPDRAPVASAEGRVTVKQAPQGGHLIYVGEHEHYVPQHLQPTVKTGDAVEAGDTLSEGVVRPDDVVKMRGIGSGRRYYANRFQQMLHDSGVDIDPVHSELIARAAVDHIKITDAGNDSVLPDDTVQFSQYQQDLDDPDDLEEVKPEEAAGKYLWKPALHYTPGTKLTARQAGRLSKAGIKAVTITRKPPGFEPEMVRMQTQSFAQPDWLAGMATSYIGRQLSQRATRGADTNIKHNINYVPRLAVGEGFGQNIDKTGEF